MTPGQRAHAGYMAAAGRAGRAVDAWGAISPWRRAVWQLGAANAAAAHRDALARGDDADAAEWCAARALAAVWAIDGWDAWGVHERCGVSGWWHAAAVAVVFVGGES